MTDRTFGNLEYQEEIQNGLSVWRLIGDDGNLYGVIEETQNPDVFEYEGPLGKGTAESAWEASDLIDDQIEQSPVSLSVAKKKNVSNKTGKNTRNVNLISGKSTKQRAKGMNRQQIAKRRTLASRERLKGASRSKKASQVFTTINDVINDIAPVFGDFVDDYDIDAVAREITEYDEYVGGFVYLPNFDSNDPEWVPDDFVGVMDRHRIAKRKANKRPVRLTKAGQRNIRKPIARSKKADFQPENGNPDILIDEFDNTLYFDGDQWIIRIVSGSITKESFSVAEYGGKQLAFEAALDWYRNLLVGAYDGFGSVAKRSKKSENEELDFEDLEEDEEFDPEEGDVDPDILARRKARRRAVALSRRNRRMAADDEDRDDSDEEEDDIPEPEDEDEEPQEPQEQDEREASVKVAAIRLADNYIELGLEDSSQRYDLMAEFSGLSDATINDRLELLSKVAHMAKKTASVREVSTPVRKASNAKVPSFARAPKMSSFDDSEDDDFMLGLL